MTRIRLFLYEVIDFVLIFGGVFLLGVFVLSFDEIRYQRYEYTNQSIIQEKKENLNKTVQKIQNTLVVSFQESRELLQYSGSYNVMRIYEYDMRDYLAGRKDKYPLAFNLLPPGKRLIVESMGINSPIVNVKYASEEKLQNADFDQELRNGVVKYPFTRDPGSNEYGSALIFGHSSVDRSDRDNPYGYVFRKLAKMQHGEKFTIIWDGKIYTYRVDRKEIVLPQDVGKTLSTYSDDRYTTLMSCYPLYTSKKRMLVRAKLVENGVGSLAFNQ